MFPSQWAAERLTEDYRKDRLRETERARLAREATGPAPKTLRRWLWAALPVLLVIASLRLIR